MTKYDQLVALLLSDSHCSLASTNYAFDDLTVECEKENILTLLARLRNCPDFAFDQLIDLCAVDYLHYGQSDWETNAATDHGFSRGVGAEPCIGWTKPRFAVVYHLLSTKHNQRIRVKVFIEETFLCIPSVQSLWKSAGWFEREAYDLFGVLFEGHTDLRRILTDYGFIGHPFRKDFPISGHVEMRYDASLGRVIYEPIDLEPRVLEPKVIRKENASGVIEAGSK